MTIRHGLTALLALALLVLAGCSTTKGNEPADLVDFDSTVKVRKLWSEGVGDGQGKTFNHLQPVVHDDVVYAASADGEVTALTLQEGDTVWDVEIDATLSAGVGANDSQVLVGTLAGELIALDARNGKFLWVTELGSQVDSAPASDGERVYVQTVDGKVLGLDARNGNRLWAYDGQMPALTQRGTSSPVLDGNLVYVGLSNGKVVCLDGKTGLLRWEGRVAIPQGKSDIERLVDIDGNPLVLGGKVYAASLQGNVVALNASSGRLEWREDASSYVNLTQGFGALYLVETNGTIKAFDMDRYLQRWEQGALSWRGLTAAVPMSSYLLVGDAEGYVHILSQVDGSFVGRFHLDGDGITATPVVTDDIALVYGNSGKLYAFRLEARH